MLQHTRLGSFEDQVLVELSTDSTLAAVLGLQGGSYPNIAGLLRLSASLEELTMRFDQIPAPVILAPHQRLSPATLCSVVGLLTSAPGPYPTATLLVDINEAVTFAPAYSHVSRFSILWDIMDVPNTALAQLADVLVENHCINPHSWNGLHWYTHSKRPVPDARERIAAFETVLRHYPVLSGPLLESKRPVL